MKKIVILSLAFLASPAFAVEVCAGAATAAEVDVAKEAGGGKFIATGFKQKCSANVFLDYVTSDTAVAVGAASLKGKNVFAGTSEGGSVAPVGTCAAAACAKGDSGGAATTALSKITGS